MQYHQPLRLNQEWVVSNNRHIYLVYLDKTICGYIKSLDEAINMISSISKNVEEELRNEYNDNKYKIFTKIEERDGKPYKFLIYAQKLGYIYNSEPILKHSLTYTASYRCYYLEKPEEKSCIEENVIDVDDSIGKVENCVEDIEMESDIDYSEVSDDEESKESNKESRFSKIENKAINMIDSVIQFILN